MTAQTEMAPPLLSTDYSLLSPNLSDILNDDQVLKFYQSVKDIKAQQSPSKTAAMFFAFCHALNQQTTFLKVPNLNRLLFRQDEKCYAVDVAGTGQESVDALYEYCKEVMRMEHSATDAFLQDAIGSTNRHSTSITEPSRETPFASSSRHRAEIPAKREAPDANNGPTAAPLATSKKAKRLGSQVKEYNERKAGMLNDLLRVSDHDIQHLASAVDSGVKQVIKGEVPDDEKNMDALARFAKYANTAAHMETDFAPRNAGVYYNYEYYQLYHAYRQYEKERESQMSSGESKDTRSISVQCRTELEKQLASTNWEAIRRRLTIGERITALAGAVGPGYLLVSKQVSGRKLLHTFNTAEWLSFIDDLSKPEHVEVMDILKSRFSAANLFGSSKVSTD